MPRSAPVNYTDEVAAQRASLEEFEQLARADASGEVSQGATPAVYII